MDEPAINGTLGRLRALAVIIKDVGLTTMTLVFFAGVFTGWIPSPIARESTLAAHVSNVKDIVALRTATDSQLTATLMRLTDLIADQQRRNRLRDCAEIKEPDLRRECLR